MNRDARKAVVWACISVGFSLVGIVAMLVVLVASR